MSPVFSSRHYKGLYRLRRIFLSLVLLFSGIVFSDGLLSADDAQPAKDSVSGDQQSQQAIQVFADRLVTNQTKSYVEFRGNVRATQGDTVITSDRLKVFYANGKSAGGKTPVSGKNVSRIIAQGKVLIRFDTRTAQTDKAEYDLQENVLILTGENSKVSSGDDYVVGRKIILRQKENNITVEGTDQKPVEALFYGVENQKTIN